MPMLTWVHTLAPWGPKQRVLGKGRGSQNLLTHLTSLRHFPTFGKWGL